MRSDRFSTGKKNATTASSPRAIGLGGVQLSGEEQEAWVAACHSLSHTPRPPMIDGEEEEEEANVTVFTEHVAPRLHAHELEYDTTRSALVVAFKACDFLTCLRLFTRDGRHFELPQADMQDMARADLFVAAVYRYAGLNGRPGNPAQAAIDQQTHRPV